MWEQSAAILPPHLTLSRKRKCYSEAHRPQKTRLHPRLRHETYLALTHRRYAGYRRQRQRLR